MLCETLHTGLYSTRAKEILSCLIRLMHCDYQFNPSKFDFNAAKYSKVEFAPNGEVVITYDRHRGDLWRCSYRKCANFNDQTGWIAWRLKLTIFKELDRQRDEKHDGWDRKNSNVSKWMTNYLPDEHDAKPITIREVYMVYDILRSRKRIENKYSKKELEEMIGAERDPFITQAEVTRRTEIERINKELEKKINDLRQELWRKQREANDALSKEYQKFMDEATYAANAEIESLNQSTNELMALAVA